MIVIPRPRNADPVSGHHLCSTDGIQIVNVDVRAAAPFDAENTCLARPAVSWRYNRVGASCFVRSARDEENEGRTHQHCNY